jgi:hypothetical protein
LIFGKEARYGGESFSLLKAMYYSYLEPVKVMTSNDVKALLPKLRDQLGLLSFDAFGKGDDAGAGAAKKVSEPPPAQTL